MIELSLLLLTACRLKGLETGADECAAAQEIPYDGVDQDCDGSDLVDVDADGFIAIEAGGDDCDDASPEINPNAEEVPYDGVDQDCSGADLADVDADGFDALESGGPDCDDANPDINPDATEVPYDGVDQDCTGADLGDVDGDGHDAAVVGGDDCDDDNASVHPGAVDFCDAVDSDCDGGDGTLEVPYDSIDQDCDGADLIDVDGDGSIGTEAGGDDCDDEDASIFAGAMEDQSDGLDNDCDGRVDEVLVCWDSSGDFETIQDGVDGTADGRTIEICPGTYTEDLVITDRALRIEGGGEDPADTSIVGAGSYSTVYLSGEGVDLTITDVAISGPGNSVVATAAQHVVIDLVDFCSVGGRASVGLWGNAAGVSVTRSYFCARAGGASIALTGVATFAENVVESDADKDDGLSTNFGDITIRNNLFTGGGQVVDIDVSYAVNVHLYNNTFADGEYLQVRGYGYPDPWSSFSFHDNIISAMSDPSVYVFDIFYDSNRNSGCSGWLPVPFRANIGYEIASLGWVECETNDSGDEWDDSIFEYGDDPLFAAGFTDEDPMFVASPGRGAYALDPASPAVDAGMGDPDPDGTPNDLGAFGGPDGNWWQEVPWLD